MSKELNGIKDKENQNKFGSKGEVNNNKDNDNGSNKNGNRRGRRGRRNGRHGSNGSSGQSNFRKGKMFNDVSDYLKNPSITDAFAKLPFSFIVGGKIPGFHGAATQQFSLLSIVSHILDWVASDTSVDNSSQSNQTILDQVKTIIYTAMRRANSGSTNNVEPIDVLMQNLIATIDILCNAVYGSKFFKIANTFSWKNRTLPKYFFGLAGFDYEDFVSNLANYRGRYNVLVAKAKTIRTLTNFPLVKVAMAEYENIFKDEDTDTGREQLIMTVKAFHHILDPVGTEAHPGGRVRLMTLGDIDSTVASGQVNDTLLIAGNPTDPNTHYKFKVFLDIMEKQIDTLVNNAEFNLIQADIEKAFGPQSGYYEIDGISETSEEISFVYSEEFLQMYHNANFLPPLDTSTISAGTMAGRQCVTFGSYVNTIYQIQSPDPTGYSSFGVENHVCLTSDNFIDRYGKLLTEGTDVPWLGGILDTNLDDPSPEQNVIMTRFKFLGVLANPADVPTEFRRKEDGGYKYVRSNGSGCFNLFPWYGIWLNYNASDSNVVNVNAAYMNVRQLRYNNDSTVYSDHIFSVNHHPFVLFQPWGGTSQAWSPMFGINNFRFLTKNEMSSINLACFLSLWNLPERTKI